MAVEQPEDFEATINEIDENASTSQSETENKKTNEPDDLEAFYQEQVLSAEDSDDEITNNDGSVNETFDTAFHNKPGYITGHSLAGSNRADFYEAREQGKTDAEEEVEYLKKHQS